MVFSILLVLYDKMATDGGDGAVDGRHGDDCKPDIGPGLKSQPGNNFFRKFLYEFIQMNSDNCYTNCIVRIRTQCGFCTNSYNCYINWIVRIHTRLYHRLPRPLGNTRLPRPVRVHSREGWVRNGIKVYSLYYQLRARSARHEGEARAASALREPRGAKPELRACSASHVGRSPSGERTARAARGEA